MYIHTCVYPEESTQRDDENAIYVKNVCVYLECALLAHTSQPASRVRLIRIIVCRES